MECQRSVVWELTISFEPSKYHEVQLLDHVRRRRLRSSNRTFEGVFAESLAAWLSVNPESVTAEMRPLTNSTANLLASIYTQGADRTHRMKRKLEDLNSPASVMEALGLEGYPIAIAEVKAPVAEGFAEGQRTPAADTVAVVITILVLGVAVVAIVCRKVRTRCHRAKMDYGLSSMDPLSSTPRTLRFGWVPRFDDIAPQKGPSPQRRNSDPGALSACVRESDAVEPARRLRRTNSDPLAGRFTPLTGQSEPEVQPYEHLNSLVTSAQGVHAIARLAKFRAEAQARRVTETAEQKAKSLIAEAEARLAAIEGAIEARADAVAEAERAKQEAQRIQEEAQRIKEEAIEKAQEHEKQAAKQAQVKAQLMQGMQNVMQQIMSEESRILHEEEMEALQYTREQMERERQHEEKEARAHLQSITEEANEASLRLQEALRFEEESKAALKRMDNEKRRLRAILHNITPSREHACNARADGESHAPSETALALDVDVHPQSSPVSVQECNLSGTPNEKWLAHAESEFGIDVDTHTEFSSRVYAQEYRPNHAADGERRVPAADVGIDVDALASTSAMIVHEGDPQKPTVRPSGALPAPPVEHRIKRFERLMKPDVKGDSTLGKTGDWGSTAHGCRRPIYPAKRGHLVKAQRPTGLELTTTGYETSSTHSSPRSADTSKDSSPRSVDPSPPSTEPTLGQGQVILEASPESRSRVYI